ncbi:hypothetical protein [Thermaerobacillus caldiproteolyticus]|uniref:hypothetical protein n=1 Tax=Thermaerobacillus caldiproteolyticus TaxID=247480 RepID=UPI001E611E0F|nr:hypothetical protein [Anoxybacillus caldiproteolyticus]
MIISLNRSVQVLAGQEIVDTADVNQITGEYFLNAQEVEKFKQMIKDLYSFLNEANQKNLTQNQEGEKYHVNLTAFKSS